jgi:hypothetical protein
LSAVCHTPDPNALVIALRPELDSFLKKRLQPRDTAARDMPP